MEMNLKEEIRLVRKFKTAKEKRLHLRINELKRKLADTDYKAIKYAEGELSAEEFAETKEQRKAWRAEINVLESKLQALQSTAEVLSPTQNSDLQSENEGETISDTVVEI